MKNSTNWTRTVKSVAWSFVGLRSRAEFEKDTQELNPLHLVVAGFVGVALFVGALVLIVNLVVKT